MAWRVDEEIRTRTFFPLSLLLTLLALHGVRVHQFVRRLHVKIVHSLCVLLSNILKVRLAHEVLPTRMRSCFVIFFTLRNPERNTLSTSLTMIWPVSCLQIVL